MKKLGMCFLWIFVFLLVVPPVSASSYIYRQRANWVKLSKLSNKQLAGQSLKHPYQGVNAQVMEAMLASIEMNKNSTFKKDIDSTQIFTSFEARKFASYIVQALGQADPNQVVNVSIIHKRPTFILRNDYVSNLNVFVTDEGIHFYFNKLFARLDGDYAQASNTDEAISKAKTLRVTLAAKEGQELSYNDPMHIILKSEYNFARTVKTQDDQIAAENEELKKPKKERKPIQVKTESTVQSAPIVTKSSVSSASGDVKVRLRKLDELKKEKLITDQEYQQKRQEILGDL